ERALAGRGGCATVDAIEGGRGTALAHWGIGALSLLLQGERPTAVIFHEEARCAAPDFERGLRLTRTYLRRRDAAGRFDLRATGRSGAAPAGTAGWIGGP